MTAGAPPPVAGALRVPALEAAAAVRGQDRVVVARRASVPLVQVRALLPGGGTAAARLAAGALLRRPDALDRLDAVEATAQVSARPDGLLLSAWLAPGAVHAGLDLLLALLRPDGEPPQDVVASEAARLTAVDAAAASDPAQIARRAALADVYGAASPYAEPLREDLLGVTPAQVAQWHAETGAAVVVVCGDVDPDDDWGDRSAPAAAAAPSAQALPVAAGPRWQARDRPGSAQTTLRAVAPIAPPGAPGRVGVELVHRLLGSGKGSRLVHELREQRGYGYHPGTTLVDLAGASYLLLEVDVATEVTADAVRVVDGVLASLCTRQAEPAELELAGRGVVGDVARAMDAQGSLADLLLAHVVAGSDSAAVTALPAQVAATTAADTRRTADGLVAALRGAATADLAALSGADLPATFGVAAAVL